MEVHAYAEENPTLQILTPQTPNLNMSRALLPDRPSIPEP